MKLKIFLTGGSGFIGKNFIEQRSKKYRILSPTHRILDLTNTRKVDSYFKQFGTFDIVIHAATVGGKRSEKDMPNVTEMNLKMFFNIIKNGAHFKKMIHFGTGAEYDKSHNVRNVEETHFGRRIPKDSFGFYKYATAKYIEHSPFNIYHVRLFGVYGKYEDYKVRLISNLICKYILKLPLTMIQNAYFDYLHVDDLIKILDYFIGKKTRQIFYNVATGKKISLLSIAKKINKLNNYSLPIKIKKKGFNKEYTCDNTRLMQELKDFTFTPIDQGIRELYNWYRKNISRIDRKAILEDEKTYFHRRSLLQ